MDFRVEQPFTAPLGRLAVSLVFRNVGCHPPIEYGLTVLYRIKYSVEIEHGSLEGKANGGGHAGQMSQTVGQENAIIAVRRGDDVGSDNETVAINDGEYFVALLVFMPGISDSVAAFLCNVYCAVAV